MTTREHLVKARAHAMKATTLGLLLALSVPALAAEPAPTLVSQATQKAQTDARVYLTTVQAAEPDDGKGGLFWAGLVTTVVSTVGLLTVRESCDGFQLGDRCAGPTSWPTGQIGGWSAGVGAGVLLMVLD